MMSVAVSVFLSDARRFCKPHAARPVIRRLFSLGGQACGCGIPCSLPVLPRDLCLYVHVHTNA